MARPIVRIDLRMADLERLVDRTRHAPLTADEHAQLKAAIDTLGYVADLLDRKGTTLAGLRQLLAWGVPSIELTIRALTDRIERGARQLGLEATPGALRGGHMLGVRFPDGAPKDLAARLAAANVHVSVRGDALRVSPHVYNTAAEADRLLAVLAGGSG